MLESVAHIDFNYIVIGGLLCSLALINISKYRGEQNNNLYDLNIISAVIQSVYIQTSILSQTVPVAPGNTQLTSVLRDFHQNQNNNLSGDIYQPAAAI